jgi:signal transduction histidine kinase
LLNSALEVYEARLRNAAITVESRHRDAREVRCYDGDIRQVLSNLVVNSIDAMRHGGRLLVRTRNQTDWRTGRPGISITIADTGSGMSAASLQRAFEPFFTTKGLNGSGLGLWICSEIMHRSEGALRLRSSDQPARHGTVARLFLPTEMVVDPGRPILEEFATETTAAA